MYFFSEDELASKKRHIKRQMVEDEEVPVNDSLLDVLILPSNISIGIQILKKMGWKPGQGVGEKTEAVHHPNQQGKGKKVIDIILPIYLVLFFSLSKSLENLFCLLLDRVLSLFWILLVVNFKKNVEFLKFLNVN